MAWTEERDAQLRALWADPTRSTRQIGLEMGVTKSAAVGRAHRLKLPPRGSPIRTGAGTRKAAQRRTAPPPAPSRESVARSPLAVIPLVPASAPPPRIPRLSTAQERACRFIAGEPAGAATIFCDAPTLRGSSYCPAHHARCWQTRPATQAAA